MGPLRRDNGDGVQDSAAVGWYCADAGEDSDDFEDSAVEDTGRKEEVNRKQAVCEDPVGGAPFGREDHGNDAGEQEERYIMYSPERFALLDVRDQ